MVSVTVAGASLTGVIFTVTVVIFHKLIHRKICIGMCLMLFLIRHDNRQKYHYYLMSKFHMWDF